MAWLISKALMNSLYSLEQVEEYLGENFLDGEQSALLSGSNTQRAYCAPDKMTGFSRLSRFGMTFKPLTESRGEELLTLYRVGFPARTLAQQEKAQGLTENDQECGITWRGWLAKFDQDTFSWKTAQCSLLEDLNESLQTLPQWGMTVGGELYLLPTLVQTTNENEFGLWLTPSTVDISTRSAESMEKRLEYRKKIGRNGVGAGCLSEQVEWSGKGVPIGYITKETWPTPTAHMAKETNAPSEALRNEPSMASRVGGKLNPTWVEWLMGWPLGWTDLKPLEMDKSLCAPLPLGEF